MFLLCVIITIHVKMLSKSSKYAIRAVLYLSLNSNEENKYNPKEIAETIDIPAPFLAKILQQLTKRNLVTSIRGRNGGFYLTDENRDNNLLSVVECIDGLDKFSECLLGLPGCGGDEPCSMHEMVAPMREKLVDELTSKTITELTKEVVKGKTNI